MSMKVNFKMLYLRVFFGTVVKYLKILGVNGTNKMIAQFVFPDHKLYRIRKIRKDAGIRKGGQVEDSKVG